jgi:hypothetical protein
MSRFVSEWDEYNQGEGAYAWFRFYYRAEGKCCTTIASAPRHVDWLFSIDSQAKIWS